MPRSVKMRGIRENRDFWAKKRPFWARQPFLGVEKSRFLKNLENAQKSSKMFGDIKLAHFDPLSNGICGIRENCNFFWPKRLFLAPT